jgi:hypothetical protein
MKRSVSVLALLTGLLTLSGSHLVAQGAAPIDRPTDQIIAVLIGL